MNFQKSRIVLYLVGLTLLTGCSSFGNGDKSLKEGISEPQKLSKDGTSIDPRDNTRIKKKKKIKLKPSKLERKFKSTVDIFVLWKKKIGKGMGNGKIEMEPNINNEKVYINDYTGALYVIDLLSGKKIWSLKDKNVEYTSSPGLGENLVIVGTGEGKLIAREKESGTLRWVSKLPSEVLSKPLETETFVIARSNDGSVHALDKKNGQEIWNFQKTAPKLSVRGNSNPLRVDDSVVIGWDDGRMTALDLETGKIIWNATVAVPTGQTDLERMVDIDGNLILDGADIYICSYGTGVTSVSSLDGKINWNREISSPFSPAVGADYVYVVDEKSIIWAFDKVTGNSVWKKSNFERRTLSPPLIYKNFLIVGDFDGYTHWLDSKTGEQVYRKKIANEAIRVSGATDNAIVVLTAQDGKTVALEFNEN